MDVCTHCGLSDPGIESCVMKAQCARCGAEYIDVVAHDLALASLRARIAAAIAECERVVSESHAAHPDRINRRERAKCAVAIQIRAKLEGR